MSVDLLGGAQSKLNPLGLYPSFSFDNEAVDGLVPSCRVENWQHFFQILDGDTSAGSDDLIYRGHRRHDWQLESTLARQFDGGSVEPNLMASLLDKFRLAMRGRGNDLTDKPDNEVWAFGQHFGLATPLLDWTGSPFVALFFAFWKGDKEFEQPNPTRAVFRLNRALLAEALPDLFFEPSLGENARLVNQAGLFTVTPDGTENLVSAIINILAEDGEINPDDPNELARYICKLHIPNSDRIACLSSLRRMNIHHANLFPDPMGASEYCNEWLSRCVREEKHKKEDLKKIEQCESEKANELRRDEVVAGYQGELRDVVEILAAFSPEDSEGDALAALAEKINARYEDSFSLDWPKQESSAARVRLAFKKLLAAQGYPDAARDRAVDALVDCYKARYAAKVGETA